MKKGKNLLLLALSVALAFACLEVVARLFAPPLPVIADPSLGYRRAPGMTLVYDQENDHPVKTVYNRQGFRGKDFDPQKAPGVFRAAIVGDSFVESSAVEFEKTFPVLAEGLLAKRLSRPCEFLNFGVSGYSPAQEYLLVRDVVLDYAPDVVAMFFFPTNDIEALSPKTANSKIQPFASLSPDGQAVIDQSFASAPRYQAKRMLTFIRRHSAFVNLLYERFAAKAGAGYQDAFHPEDGLPPYLTLCTDAPDPELLRNYQAAKALFRQAAALCRARGAAFVLVLVDHDGADPAQAARYAVLAPSFDPLWFERDLARQAETDGYGFIGLQSAFMELYRRDGKRLHWRHWNYAGHEAVAERLAQALENGGGHGGL